MPQIDERDLGELIHWLDERGVPALPGTISPKLLHGHQAVDMTKAIAMPDEVLEKRVLIATDLYILDGNHRWAGHYQRHDPEMPIITIEQPFDEAVELLFNFPKTYAYGDGKFHPVSY